MSLLTKLGQRLQVIFYACRLFTALVFTFFDLGYELGFHQLLFLGIGLLLGLSAVSQWGASQPYGQAFAQYLQVPSERTFRVFMEELRPIAPMAVSKYVTDVAFPYSSATKRALAATPATTQYLQTLFRFWQAVNQQQPTHRVVLTNLAELAAALNQPQLALEYALRAQSLDPNQKISLSFQE